MQLKYVRHERIGFVLWPITDEPWHSHIGRLLESKARGGIVSAGFADLSGDRPRCFGRSESLEIGSREDDSAALAEQLGIMRDKTWR